MYIDLSQPLDEFTPVFPGDIKIHLSKDKTLIKGGYNSFIITSSFHAGTHIDLPMHMLDDGRTAADFPLEIFCGKGVLLDVRGEQFIEPKAEYEKIIGKSDIVLLMTDHDKFYGKPEYFKTYPEISKNFVDFLISKKIKILGLDTPSPDYSPFNIHKKLLRNDIFILENLTNLEKLLLYKSFEVFAFPLKIKTEASFVRAAAKILE